MNEVSNISDMPRGKNIKQVGFSANPAKRAAIDEAASRGHLQNRSDYVRIATEEKLMREYPDLYKIYQGK